MKLKLKTFAVSAGLYFASLGNAYAAGVDAILIFPLGLVFIVGVLIAVIKNASPSRRPVVGFVAASHILCWFVIFYAALSAGGKFRYFRVDTIDIYVTYPIAASFYLFFTYNILSKVKNDKTFSYTFISITAIAYIVVGLFIY